MGMIRAVIRGGRLMFESVYGVLRRPKSSQVVEMNPGPSARSTEPQHGPIPAARAGGAGTDEPDRELSQHWEWPR